LKGSSQENHAQIIRHGRNKTVGGKRGGVGGYARESFAYEVELEIHRKAMALDVRSTVRGLGERSEARYLPGAYIHKFIHPLFRWR